MKFTKLIAVIVLLAGAQLATAAEMPSVELSIENHQFTPSEITIPADSRVKLVITNNDVSTEEFESKALHIEKMIGGGKTVTIKVGPLKPGTYSFVGEFHEDTAQGRIVVK
jgi:plastocyanin